MTQHDNTQSLDAEYDVYAYAQLVVVDDAITRCVDAMDKANRRGNSELFESLSAQLGALQAQRARLGVLAQQLQEQGD